jgi:organic hydroperoxide reductase OsmC/OhrA
MQDFPHRYAAAALAGPDGDVELESARLPRLVAAAPAEFGGPGDRWSPETLLVAAVANCFALTFRAVAGASRFPWISLRCEAEGVLDRIDRVTRFTELEVRAHLRVHASAGEERAHRLLERTEQSCLITNSMSARSTLHASVEVES